MGLLTRRKSSSNLHHIYNAKWSPNLIGNSLYASADLALANSDIYAAIALISSDVAGAKFSSNSKPQVVDLLNSPSGLINGFSFWQQQLIQLLLDGNDYVQIIRGLNGQLTSLKSLPNSIVHPYLTPDGQSIIYQVDAVNSMPPETLLAPEVMHFRLMPDKNGIGVSPLQSLVNYLQISQANSQLQQNQVANQINPGGILNFKNANLNANAKKAAREAFESANTGPNGGHVMVLDSNSEYQPFEIKADLLKALTDNANFGASQVSKAFGIPSDLLGSESEHSNIDQMKSTYIGSIMRYANAVIDEVSEKIGIDDVEMDIESSLDIDSSTAITQINSMMQAQTITYQQAQAMLIDKGILKGGDNIANSN